MVRAGGVSRGRGWAAGRVPRQRPATPAGPAVSGHRRWGRSRRRPACGERPLRVSAVPQRPSAGPQAEAGSLPTASVKGSRWRRGLVRRDVHTTRGRGPAEGEAGARATTWPPAPGHRSLQELGEAGRTLLWAQEGAWPHRTWLSDIWSQTREWAAPSLSLCPRRPGNNSQPAEGKGPDSRLGCAGTSGSPGPTGTRRGWPRPPAATDSASGTGPGQEHPEWRLCHHEAVGCVWAGRLPGSVPTHMRLSLALPRHVRGACCACHCPRPRGRVCEQSRQDSPAVLLAAGVGGAVGRAGCLGHYLELGCVCVAASGWTGVSVCALEAMLGGRAMAIRRVRGLGQVGGSL